MARKRKGLFGSIINLFGYGVLLVLFLMATSGIMQSYGGAEAMLNKTITDEGFRNNFIWHHVAFDMITPLYPVELGPWSFNVALDDGGFLVIVLISFTLSIVLFAVLRLFYDLHWPWLFVIFPVMLALVGFVWQNYWIMVYLDTGQKMGMAQDEMLATLKGSQDIVSNTALLAMTVFSMLFLLFKGKGLFHT